MREKVLIVLNEREPAKKEAAARLEAALAAADITSSRGSADTHIAEIIRLRRPAAVVLDYLLGEVTTGLDVMEALAKLPEPPAVYFLTDEPSVSVAVSALGGGASGYFELDKSTSIPRLVEVLTSVVRESDVRPPRPKRRSARTLPDLVLSSPAARALAAKLHRASIDAPALSVVSGAGGSGRSAVAMALVTEIGCLAHRLEVDLRTFTGRAEEIFDPLFSNCSAPRAVIVENAEEDDGNVLSCASDVVASLTVPLHVVFVTRDLDTRSWSNRGAEVFQLPPLSDRREDIPALSRAFWREAEELSGERLGQLRDDQIEILGSLDYPGHVRQLRSMVIESALDTSHDFEQAIAASYARWKSELQTEASFPPIGREDAARALHIAGMDYRIAAARLGCSVRELYGVVNREPA